MINYGYVCYRLTEQHLDILMYAACGYTNKRIALMLGIKERTIKNHFGNIFKLLDVDNRTSAVVIALHYAFIEIPEFFGSLL